MARLLVFPVIVLAPFVVSYTLVLVGTTGATRQRVAVLGGAALLVLALALTVGEVLGLTHSGSFG
jgi:hypothetical protein